MRIIRIVISAILIGVVIVSGTMLELKLNEYRTAQDIHTKMTKEVRKGRKVDFDKLEKENPDVCGWIYVKDTQIDYPIVQGKDNDYYLHRDFDGSYLYDGCIFVDAAVSSPFSKYENTVIYGHRMNSGAMFHDLRNFEDEEFFTSHNKIIIETKAQSYDLHVIAFCAEDSDSDLYTVSFADETSELPREDRALKRSEFLELVSSKAQHLSNELVMEDDPIVTLSTCVYSDSDARIQIIGILKDAPLEDKTVEVKTEKPFINKWLLAQIGVGILMVVMIMITIVPGKKKSR